ncbi:MAG TPA: hypothetical protein VFE37_22670 [Chloroflexota bacterium]|nr:hypothetical protein [Chloroflexota bacterium]
MPNVAVGLALFAGLAAAYVQAIAGYWLEGVPGQPRVDIAEAGKRYLGGDGPGWWAVGMLAHLCNGALLGLLYAGAVYPWAAPGGQLPLRLAVGAGYGVAVWVVILNLLVMPLAGAGLFGRHGRPLHYGRATLILHILYGITLGAIYHLG